jgi:hypothetical protein
VDREPEDRGFVLLGIKYEAATLGGVDGAGLARIQEQIQAEAGDSWATHPMVVRGRNAVRAEHGLAPLGARPREPARDAETAERPLWRRLFGK